jgi:hypothetical protein
MTDRLKLAWALAVFSTLIFASRLAISDFWPYVPETDPTRIMEIWRQLCNMI